MYYENQHERTIKIINQCVMNLASRTLENTTSTSS